MLVNMKRVDLQAIKSGPKFKLLYNIKATAHFSVKTLKECQDTVHNASFNTFGAKFGRLLTPQTVRSFFWDRFLAHLQ